jgi:pterin-4a-carbinolamine dehydratase
MKYIFPYEYILLLLLIIKIESKFEMDLSILLEQIENHPNQTLQDVYKSCYQDEYGPGHLISNESSAINSLLQEINTIEKDYAPITLFERTGIYGNYLRVDLTLVRDGIIPFFVLFRALTISATIGGQKSDENWSTIWSEIVEEIKREGLKFENFEEDLANLDTISKSEDKVVHHSEMYENVYHPHYRIIEKNAFEKFIKPFIK